MVRVGIIGCGQVANFHVQGLSATNAKITALADINMENARKIGTCLDDVRIYDDYTTMLTDKKLDAVVIGLQNNLHHKVILDCVEAGKAVFCEKPLTADVKESKDIVDRINKNNIIFMIGFMKRYHQAFMRMKEMINGLGPVIHGRVRQCIYVPIEKMRADILREEWWGWDKTASRGGALVHSGSHEIDLIRFLMGEPATVTAQLKYVDGLDAMEHYCAAMLEMQEGFSVLLDVTTMPYSKHNYISNGWIEEVEVYCEKGWVKLKNYSWDGSNPPELVCYSEAEQSVKNIFFTDCMQWENEMNHFIHCIENNETPMTNQIDGYRVDQIISDAYISGKENRKQEIVFAY